MVPKNTALVLVLLSVASGLAWIGAPVLAKSSPNSQAIGPAQPRTRHVAVLKGAGGELTFDLLELSHSILSPRDSASGLPSGKRQHKPFTITKPVDSSSPMLLKACIEGEPYSVEITTFVRTGGRLTPFTTVRLDNAFVGEIHPQSGNDRPTEEVAFYYNKIAFSYAQTGTTVEDFWSGEYP
jgi:type VI secretion system secreted protein Hcp